MGHMSGWRGEIIVPLTLKDVYKEAALDEVSEPYNRNRLISTLSREELSWLIMHH